MIYKWTTLKPVIGKIVRDTRTSDGSYFDDMTDWIDEAISLMKTRFQLELQQECIDINFHHADLPCAFESLIAVSYQGQRIKESGGTRMKPAGGFRNVTFQTVVDAPQVTGLDEVSKPGGTVSLKAIEHMPCNEQIWYRLNYNKIETNLEDGELTLYFWSKPTDEDGFPMIPDNQLYKEAIYWYVRMKMIGTGYKDTVFEYQDCEKRWDDYMGKAMAQITYPTVDAIQRNIQTNVRLVKDVDLWSSFGQGPAPEGDYQ